MIREEEEEKARKAAEAEELARRAVQDEDVGGQEETQVPTATEGQTSKRVRTKTMHAFEAKFYLVHRKMLNTRAGLPNNRMTLHSK